jgi:hypothetical protein
MTPQPKTKPPEPYKLPDAQRKKLSKFLKRHFAEQSPDFQNRFWNKLKGSRDWVNRFWPAVLLVLFVGCAPVVAIKETSPSALSVASITPLPPPAEVGSGYMADPLNYYPLNRDNLEGVGFDKRPKNIYVSHDLITWTLATSNPIASAFFWSDNSPACFFRVGNNKPANVSVEKLCNITIINRAF